MSEIHIGPHTRDETHGPGDTHHTYDREIDLKSIAKWMGGLLVVTIITQILMWWMLRGMEQFDKKQDPELMPIETQMKQEAPPEPRLQVGPGFSRHNQDALSNSDLEDMQALRRKEDSVLGEPAWVDQAQGRLRVPIDVAMQVIASRGAQSGGAAAGTVTPDQMRQQVPAGTAPGAPGALMQMTRPQAPAQPAAGAQPAGAAQGTAPQTDQAAPRPPAR